MGIVMGMSIPFMYHALRKEKLHQSIRDIEEVCSNARARAIMQGSMAELVFHAGPHNEVTFEVAGAAAPPKGDEAVAPGTAVPSESGLSTQLPDGVAPAAFRINGIDYMQASEGRVRFYPNGTCDELRLVLLGSSEHPPQMRGIFLEVTTGLATVESDQNKLMSEVR
jgi:hypothetical protein